MIDNRCYEIINEHINKIKIMRSRNIDKKLMYDFMIAEYETIKRQFDNFNQLELKKMHKDFKKGEKK